MELPTEIVAALGPTNTGKTYRALQRMKEHRSGMIGFPLRLLAREVYDSLTAELGEARVALVTGEEKRIPKSPSYWICTVEAMPRSLAVDFLAVDEIQLAAHRERGHVFTDRLLFARGLRETWFMGSSSMTAIIQRLIPGVDVQRFPRLSRLSSVGGVTLGSLPRRSAVVGFSATRVYEIAGRLKARRGGSAIVLGALSPRARNAQVAMYQAGDVDYLVATDAIGMGLNLDVDHVAFADTSKFDGKETRELEVPELAQIAGRAGRYQRDGTFGVLAPREALPRPIELAIENHQFHAVRSLIWRSPDLAYSSVENLLESLAQKPPVPELQLVREAEDTMTLTKLARRPEIRERATDESRVRLLWDVCQIPDYRKLLLDQHATLVAEVYTRLVDAGVLESRWLDHQLERLDRHDADVETLTSRIAFTRTWTYVACHDEWVDDPAYWQARTRALEDRLSDALHLALVQRFVEGKKRGVAGPSAPPARAAGARPAPFAELAALKAKWVGEMQPSGPSLVERVPSAPHEALSLEVSGDVLFEGTVLARLVAGRKLLEPELKLLVADDRAGLQLQIKRRLVAFVHDWIEQRLEPLSELGREAEVSAPARGLIYRLRVGLGAVVRDQVDDVVEHLTADDRRVLAAAGIVVGDRTVFVKSLLRPAAVADRALLVRTFTGAPPLPSSAMTSRTAWKISGPTRTERLIQVGFLAVGTRAIRCDIVEKIVQAGSAPESQDRFVSRVAAWCGSNHKEARRIATLLGAGPAVQAGV